MHIQEICHMQGEIIYERNNNIHLLNILLWSIYGIYLHHKALMLEIFGWKYISTCNALQTFEVITSDLRIKILKTKLMHGQHFIHFKDNI
jgi:hypothetical protein